MRLAAVVLLAFVAGCAPQTREGFQPVRGPTVSIGGGVGTFLGTAR